MAKFKRRERGLKVEFGKKSFFIDITNPETGKKLNEFGAIAESEEFDKLPHEEQKDLFKKFFNELLGETAYEDIKTEVYEDRELFLEELIDVGFYILEEVTEYNKELNVMAKTITEYAASIK